MYGDVKVPVPTDKGRITKKTIKGTTYVYYMTDRVYDSKKKYNVPISTTIGKCCPDDSTMMIPNSKYLLYYPDAKLPSVKQVGLQRSSCLRIGAYITLQKIIAEYHFDELLQDIIGDDSGLFLDLAVYTIVTENNAGQYYPNYAFNHPLFTRDMRVYSDSKVSSFINELTREQSTAFLEQWNARCDHREKIYISYDSTNKNCQAGDVEFLEYGHAKEDKDKPILNYSIAYDRNNSRPLYYEVYPGSVVDISQLQYMLKKADGYGYHQVGFILDRGYFSEENIRFMDNKGIDFVIMMKGKKNLVKDLVKECRGTFEDDRRYSIRKYDISGTTVKGKLFTRDKKERYFHVFYNGSKHNAERRKLEEKIDIMAEFMKVHEGEAGYEMPSGFGKYFEAFYHTNGDVKTFVAARELHDAINEDIRLCGYFVLITSEKMSAEDAITLYKSRDASEKLFRGDKSYLGNKAIRVHSGESVRNKIFIEFVALILRNRFFTLLQEQIGKSEKKENFMSVPAALQELEKIEMVRLPDGNYRLDYAVTKAQKEILKAFGMTERTVNTCAIEINKQLQDLAKTVIKRGDE